jgi:hypothetical protein
MRIRYVWRGCNFQNGEWGATPQNAFWVKATRAEAEAKIFRESPFDPIDETHIKDLDELEAPP